ncbi:MAG: SDR family oxidoreductase [Pseudomonadota bacterium]
MKDLFDLQGKVALVTGASRGIGESIARLLAAKGAHVIVSSRNLTSCEAVASSICSDGFDASAFACHVGEVAQITSVFEHIKKTHGRLDILVNNAAANPYFGHIIDTELGAFTKTVDVNIRGYFFMSCEAGKLMRKQGGGVILNTASITGVSPGEYQGIYSITKAAVISMTKAFANECGSLNIRCNALLPGLTDTKFASTLTSDESTLKKILAQIPLGRVADPDEMAGTVLYLVSDASSYTTGATVIVDGGMLA